MNFSQRHLDELNRLLPFDIGSAATGINVHTDASDAAQSAAQRLFEKQLCTQPDGGYLTNEGIAMAEQADRLLRVLSA